MSSIVVGLGLGTAAAAVGAVAACIKGISQQYSGSIKSAIWVLGFTVGFGVLFSALMGVCFAGESIRTKQAIAILFLVGGPVIIAFASEPQNMDGMWCPIDASTQRVMIVADMLTKAMYLLGVALLIAGYVFKKGNTGGVADYRVLGWIVWASIFHTLQANRIHQYNWDPFKDMMYLDHVNWQITGLASPERLQVSYGVLAATVLFQTAETMAFANAGVVGPVHAAYIGTLIIDAMLHDMGNGQFLSYSCTQYWILSIGVLACFIGAAFAASIKHSPGHGHVKEEQKKSASKKND